MLGATSIRILAVCSHLGLARSMIQCVIKTYVQQK